MPATTTTPTPEQAYRLGYRASGRTGHDLERDEARFIAKHGLANNSLVLSAWLDGWDDYACGYQPQPLLNWLSTTATDPVREATNAVIDAAEAASDPVVVADPSKVTPAEADAIAQALAAHFHPTCPACGHRS